MKKAPNRPKKWRWHCWDILYEYDGIFANYFFMHPGLGSRFSKAQSRNLKPHGPNEALHVPDDDAWAADVMRGDWVWWEVNHRWYLPQSSAAALPAGASCGHRGRPAGGARAALPAAKEASGRLPLTHTVLTRECMETCTKALWRLHILTRWSYLLPAEQLNVALWSEEITRLWF